MWCETEELALLKALAVLAKMQNAYGKAIDAEAVLAGFKMILAKKYTAAEVLHGLEMHMQVSPAFPTPAEINTILDPTKPKISQSQYIEACKRHAAEGYPMHGYYGQIKADYERQQSASRTDWQEQRQKIQAITQPDAGLLDHASSD